MDKVVPTGKWEFDAEVTRVFDDMLSRSIPDYDGMRRTTTELAARFAVPGTSIVDLGCSRGASLAPIINTVGPECEYIGLEVSEPMLEAARDTIGSVARIEACDLRRSYPAVRSSVTLSVLTLQFVPIEYRQQIIQRVYDSTVSGGVFLFVEKVLGADAFADATFVDTYLARKGENGYTAEQIATKRESLEGVLVPVTAKWNTDLLRDAGFHHVDCYWRHLNFAAWLAVKP